MAHVQSTGVQSSGAVSSQAVQFASNNGSLNTVAVVVGSYLSTGAVTLAVTDDALNTYTQAVTLTYNQVPNRSRTSGFYANSAAGGGTRVTVTVTPSAPAFVTFGIEELSGRHASNAPTVNSGTANSTAPSSGSVAVSAANTDVVGGFQHEGSTTTIAGAGSTNLRFSATSATNEPGGSGDVIAVASAASVDFTLGAAALWGAVGMAFGPSGAAVPVVHPPRWNGPLRYFGRRPSKR